MLHEYTNIQTGNNIDGYPGQFWHNGLSEARLRVINESLLRKKHGTLHFELISTIVVYP